MPINLRESSFANLLTCCLAGPTQLAGGFGLDQQGGIAAGSGCIDAYVPFDHIAFDRCGFADERQNRTWTPSESYAQHRQDTVVGAAGNGGNTIERRERFRSKLSVQDRHSGIIAPAGKRSLGSVGDHDSGIACVKRRRQLCASRVRACTQAEDHSARHEIKPV